MNQFQPNKEIMRATNFCKGQISLKSSFFVIFNLVSTKIFVSTIEVSDNVFTFKGIKSNREWGCVMVPKSSSRRLYSKEPSKQIYLSFLT